MLGRRIKMREDEVVMVVVAAARLSLLVCYAIREMQRERKETVREVMCVFIGEA